MKITLDTSSRTFQTFFTFSLFTFSILLLGTATYSWTNPSGTAPNNNVAAPVNVGSTSQIKSGPLGVNGLHNTGNTALDGNLGVGYTSPTQRLDVNGYTRSTGFCIGSSCITSWSQAGGGGVSQNTTVSCNGESCTVNCPSGYYRTGCSFHTSGGGNPSGSNGCRVYSQSGGTGTAYAYCAR